MNLEKWKKILSDAGYADVLYEETWNEDAPLEISILVKEIRDLTSKE